MAAIQYICYKYNYGQVKVLKILKLMQIDDK